MYGGHSASRSSVHRGQTLADAKEAGAKQVSLKRGLPQAKTLVLDVLACPMLGFLSFCTRLLVYSDESTPCSTRFDRRGELWRRRGEA